MEAKAKADAEKEALKKLERSKNKKKDVSGEDQDDVQKKLNQLRQEEDNKRLAHEANLATASVLGGGDSKWAKWSKGSGGSTASTPKKGTPKKGTPKKSP